MRRAIIATAGTVVALVALLDYKSSNPIGSSHVAVGTASGTSPRTTPSSSAPATSTPATSTPATAVPTTAATGAFTGTDVSYQYGTIQVRIAVQGRVITAITIPAESARDPRSESINAQAVPILTAEALKAQGMSFDVVSGATYTSDAFAQSFSAALKEEGS